MAKRSKKDEELTDEPVSELQPEPASETAAPEPDGLMEADITAGLVDKFAPPPARTVAVKFTGPTCAVLGGKMMLHGETRTNVPRAMLEQAEKMHPGEFEIVEG